MSREITSINTKTSKNDRDNEVKRSRSVIKLQQVIDSKSLGATCPNDRSKEKSRKLSVGLQKRNKKTRLHDEDCYTFKPRLFIYVYLPVMQLTLRDDHAVHLCIVGMC